MQPFGKARANKGIKLNKSFGGSLSLGVLLSYKLRESYKEEITYIPRSIVKRI